MVGLSKAHCPVFTEIKLRQPHKAPLSIPIKVAVLNNM
jgi:hypothetical protein